MDQSLNTVMKNSSMVEFSAWYADGKLTANSFNIGPVTYGTSGNLKLELSAVVNDIKQKKALVFHAPLAVRIVSEGSLMDYWNSGFVVRTHNVFISSNSEFLNWLEHSSSGVHAADSVKHYAIFTDDICVEILSREAPEVVAVTEIAL
jgi:hypothetical protein